MDMKMIFFINGKYLDCIFTEINCKFIFYICADNFYMKSRILIFLLFGLIFCSISLVNHYLFRTYAFDLGINNNALFDYRHFRWNDCMIMQPQFTNVLSDHFSIFPILVSPFSWIFGSYTMLIFQILSILIGGYGIYKLVKLKTNDEFRSNLAIVHFFSVWGIYSALAFDYHDNVVAAMLVPWIIYFYETRSYKSMLLLTIAFLFSKENMALWGGFIFLSLAFRDFKMTKQRNLLLLFSIFSFLTFIILIKILIPSLADSNRGYLHFHYHTLGNNYAEAIKFMVTHPVKAIELLFINTTGDKFFNGIKLETYLMLLFSGGIFLFFRPWYLIMLIPVIFQKMYNEDFMKWGINVHYSIEFVPVLSMALFIGSWSWIGKKTRLISWILSVLTIITFGATIQTLNSRKSKWYESPGSRFYHIEHYYRDFDVRAVYEDLKLIPENAVVSATSPLVPHLAFRDYLYQFPEIKQSEYLVINPKENPYPLNHEDLGNKLKELESDPNWEKIQTKSVLTIFHRKNL